MQPANKVFSEDKKTRIKQYLNRYLESLHDGRRNAT